MGQGHVLGFGLLAARSELGGSTPPASTPLAQRQPRPHWLTQGSSGWPPRDPRGSPRSETQPEEGPHMALKMSPGYQKLFPLVCAVSIYCVSAVCTVRG